jgi:hypothetical protein
MLEHPEVKIATSGSHIFFLKKLIC